MSLLERFEERYIPEPNSGCFLWTGVSHGNGYGGMTDENRKNAYAHRVSWRLFRGEIPKGLWVLHKCDTPCCVNPDHLFLGTGADNHRDMMEKGRQNIPFGERHHCAKLTVQQVLEIRLSKDRGTALALKYGVDKSTVYKIRDGKKWKHVQ